MLIKGRGEVAVLIKWYEAHCGHKCVVRDLLTVKTQFLKIFDLI